MSPGSGVAMTCLNIIVVNIGAITVVNVGLRSLSLDCNSKMVTVLADVNVASVCATDSFTVIRSHTV